MPHLAQDDRAEMHAHAHAQRLVELDRKFAIERGQGHGHAARGRQRRPGRRVRAAGDAEQGHDPVADELVDEPAATTSMAPPIALK